MGEPPPGFAPLGGDASPEPPRRTTGEGPRLRLNASASRRNAPDRQQAAAASALAAPEPALVAPPPTTPPRVPRRLALVAATACVLVLLVGVALLLQPADRTSTAPVATPAEAMSDFDPPVDLGPDREYVETEVLDGDDLLVTHWVSTTAPMDKLRVRPPSSPGLADLVVDVEDLVVAADGVPIGAGAVDVPQALPSARRLYVRYRLVGALQRTSSVEDRGLATVTSLDVGLEGRSLPRTQVFPGGRVMTVACLAQGARAVPESCGTYVEGAWQVASPAGEVPVAVIAQLDLAITR